MFPLCFCMPEDEDWMLFIDSFRLLYKTLKVLYYSDSYDKER